jgi:hypothetical protein
MLSFSQNLRNITFKVALESIIQLCTFLLKISKVTKNGGVVDLDLFPYREAFKITCILGVFASLDGAVLFFLFFVSTLISLEFLAVLP